MNENPKQRIHVKIAEKKQLYNAYNQKEKIYSDVIKKTNENDELFTFYSRMGVFWKLDKKEMDAMLQQDINAYSQEKRKIKEDIRDLELDLRKYN